MLVDDVIPVEIQEQFVSNSPPITKGTSSYSVDWDNLDESSNPFDSKVEKMSITNVLESFALEKPVDEDVVLKSVSSEKSIEAVVSKSCISDVVVDTMYLNSRVQVQ